jgi:hypothetical protein
MIESDFVDFRFVVLLVLIKIPLTELFQKPNSTQDTGLRIKRVLHTVSGVLRPESVDSAKVQF